MSNPDSAAEKAAGQSTAAPFPTGQHARRAAVGASKLSRDHFAFLRGRSQGLPPKELWNRYLERLGPYDERRCRKFQRELAHQLAAIARRSGNPEWAPLLQRNKELIVDGLWSTSDARNTAALPAAARPAK